MPTKNPRKNVMFQKAIAKLLTDIAKHEQKSVSNLIEELVLEALDHREDMYFSALADKIDIKGAKTVKHKDVWK